jgi:hypothetical protein
MRRTAEMHRQMNEAMCHIINSISLISTKAVDDGSDEKDDHEGDEESNANVEFECLQPEPEVEQSRHGG